MSKTSQFIQASWDERILVLTFSDPSSRNSFSLQAARELLAHLEENVGRFDAFVFRARGRVFCSGGNLSDYASMTTAEQGHAVNREIRAILGQVASWPEPSVCAVAGDAFGGGVELASAFDVILAAPHVAFALWQRRIGLSFGWGGGARLERRIGSGRLREWSLSTRLVAATEAADAGLVDRLVPEALLDRDAILRAHELAVSHRDPLVESKSKLGETPQSEVELFEKLWWSEEHRASLAPRKRNK